MLVTLFFSFLLSICGVACLASSVGVEHPQYRLPEVKYADLASLDERAGDQMLSYLSQVGAIQITGIPRFGMLRKRALEDLAECFVDESSAPSMVMPDGARRVSCGAASQRGVAQRMSSVCGDASEKLRAVVDAASRQVFLALDQALHLSSDMESIGESVVMAPSYATISDVMQSGEHLEHLHTYYAPAASSAGTTNDGSAKRAAPTPTLGLHVDSGLMIAMTKGMYSDNAGKAGSSGLLMSLAESSAETLVEVVVDDDALIVMMGDGANRWLKVERGNSKKQSRTKPTFRAVPHMLVADLPLSSTATKSRELGAWRSWYGKMYLPPADGLVEVEEADEKKSAVWMAFADYQRTKTSRAAPLSQVNGAAERLSVDLLPAACDDESTQQYSSYYRKQQQQKAQALSAKTASLSSSSFTTTKHNLRLPQSEIAVEDACLDDQIYCWARCMSTTEVLETSATCKLPNSEVVCWNFLDNAPMPGADHCMGGNDDSTGGIYCGPACVVSSSVNTSTGSSNDFCYGAGTTMFMTGFQTTSSGIDNHNECVNLLFDTWTLNSSWKFAVACVGVFLLGVFLQSVPLWRNWLVGHPAFAAKLPKTSNSPTATVPTGPVTRFLHANCSPLVRRYVLYALITLLFGIDKVLSYFLMLVAMIYNVELFVMLVLGLMCGFALLHAPEVLEQPKDAKAKWGEACCDDDGMTSLHGQGGAGDLRQHLLAKEEEESSHAKGQPCPCAGDEDNTNGVTSSPLTTATATGATSKTTVAASNVRVQMTPTTTSASAPPAAGSCCGDYEA